MKKMIFHLVALSFIVMSVSACSQNSKSDSAAIATINKSEITVDDYITNINRVPEWARNQFGDEAGREKFLDEMIKREVIFQQAKKMRLHKDNEFINKMKEFEQMTLVSMILKKEIEEHAVVDDEEIKTFYERNSDKFRIGTELKASHILVETEQEATGIEERIRKGENFSKLARSLSKDKTSAEKGGDLGFFGRGKMVPEFERALVGLKPGEVSGPVRTRFGYHIIKLVDIKQGDLANFEQSKESIRQQLAAEKKKRLFDSYVERLKGESKIQINKKTLATIELPWGKAEKTDSPPQEKAESK